MVINEYNLYKKNLWNVMSSYGFDENATMIKSIINKLSHNSILIFVDTVPTISKYYTYSLIFEFQQVSHNYTKNLEEK